MIKSYAKPFIIILLAMLGTACGQVDSISPNAQQEPSLSSDRTSGTVFATEDGASTGGNSQQEPSTSNSEGGTSGSSTSGQTDPASPNAPQEPSTPGTEVVTEEESSGSSANSTPALISSLDFTGVSLEQTFDSSRTNYSGTVSSDTESVQLTTYLTDGDASLSINGQQIIPGRAVTLNLTQGENTFTVETTANDGSSTAYQIVITRESALSNNANLASLVLTGASLDQTFSGSRTRYTATVNNSTSRVEVSARQADSAATLSLDGQPLASGESRALNLSVGVNAFDIGVLAEDRAAENIYTIEITRESAPVATTAPNTTTGAVAIDMTFNLLQNRQKFITLAAYSNDITYRRASYRDPVIDFGVRYLDAITSWDLQSLPSYGTLYEGYNEITTLPYSVTNPDDLLYVPDMGHVGNDAFTFSVQDSSSVSNVATITLITETSVTPPAGIPALPDIFHTPTPTPASVGDTETIDWYIDNSHPNATDEPRAGESSPRHGTPETPRATIPPSGAMITAGARVFISGGVATPYELRRSQSWHRWNLIGSADRPIYVLGVNRGPNKPIISGPGKSLRLEIQYTVIDGLNFQGMAVIQRNDTGRATGGNVAVKHTIFDRDNYGRTGSGASLNRGDVNVLYDVHVRNAGRTEPDLSRENDVHGIQISNVSDFWILDSMIHHSAGDSVQINGEFAQGIYIGRNKFHSDNENALDFKRRYDLVFVENDVWDYRAIAYGSSGSDGTPVIINQDTSGQTPTYSVVARNRIWDANGGIRHQGNQIWSTDNVFWHIHHNKNTSSRSYAIVVGNNADADYIDHITNNTFHQVDGGIFISASANRGVIDHRYVGNAFGTLNSDSLERLHVSINSNHDQGTTLDYNYYAEPAAISWAKNIYTVSELRTYTGQGRNSVDQIDLQFRAPAIFDLRPQPTSPLVDANIEHSAYRQIQGRYGNNGSLDNDRKPRPINGDWDIGAYESD